MAVSKRQDKNSSLYKKLDVNTISEFAKDLNFFINKDRTYYDAVKQNIAMNLTKHDLYTSSASSDEQKYARMNEQIKSWMNELKQMVNLSDDSNTSSIAKSQWYLEHEQMITDLYTKVFGTSTDYELKEKMADEFASHYKKHALVDARVWTEKMVNYENNQDYKKFLKANIDKDKSLLANAKRALNHYKIKWVWYVIPLGILIVGAILAIVLPAVL